MSFRQDFQRRDALLRASVDAFVAAGFEGASLNEILARAGVSKGQFYHHFRDKEDLYLGVVEAMIDRKQAHFAANPLPPAADPVAGLLAALRAGLVFARENPEIDAFGRSFLRERGRPIFTRALARFSVGGAPGVGDLIGRLAAGSGLAPAFVGRLVGLLLQNVVDLLDAGSPEAIEAGLEELGRFLRGGLGQSPESPAQDGLSAPPSR